MRKWEIALLFGLILAVLATNFTSFAQACPRVRSDTLRLHIVANSDSDADQAEKLAVRDAVLAQFGPLLARAQGREEAVTLVSAHGGEILACVHGVLEALGSSHTASLRLVEMEFPVCEYDGFTLPAGWYDAVRIELGDAVGHNWFCVMYPPLCLSAASDGAMELYDEDERAALTCPYKIKFAALEWIESLARGES